MIISDGLNDTYQVKKLNESGDRGFQTTARVSQLKIWTGHKSDSPECSSGESDGEGETSKEEDVFVNQNNCKLDHFEKEKNVIANEKECRK